MIGAVYACHQLKHLDKLAKAGLNLKGTDSLRYNLNDSLATSKDLESLFEVLSNCKDNRGNYAVFYTFNYRR